jgi:hypothetical protein
MNLCLIYDKKLDTSLKLFAIKYSVNMYCIKYFYYYLVKFKIKIKNQSNIGINMYIYNKLLKFL